MSYSLNFLKVVIYGLTLGTTTGLLWGTLGFFQMAHILSQAARRRQSKS